MNKKGAIELSIQTIVIIILALFVLGILITFVTKWLNFNLPPIGPPEIPADKKNPIQLPYFDQKLERNKAVTIQWRFYNNENNDITSDKKPEITCGTDTDGNEILFSTSTNGQDVEIGKEVTYSTVIKVNKEIKRGTYPCTWKLSETSTAFNIIVE